MLKKILSKLLNNRNFPKKEVDFFSLSQIEKEKIIKKAVELSTQDQKNLLKEYERKFGEPQASICK